MATIQTYQPKSILVTGGAGFIGSHFIHHALPYFSHTKIINYDKLTYAGSLDRLKNLSHPDRYHFVQGDVGNEKQVHDVMQHHAVDTIVHFAAESHVDRSIQDPNIFITTNIIGTGVLLKVARDIWLNEKKYDATQCRFHHISTDEVFGSLSIHDLPTTETSPYQPRSPYAASKAASDHLVQAYHHTYRLPITLSYCSNNYGTHQHEEKFIPTVIRSCLQSQPIPIYGTGNNIRDWIHVEDHCRGIVAILEKGNVGESYNISAQNEWDNLSLAKFICTIFDKVRPQNQSYTRLIKHIPDRAGHDFRYALDNTKMKNRLAWQVDVSFENRLREVIKSIV